MKASQIYVYVFAMGCALFLASFINQSTSELAVAKAFYEFSHVNDTSKRNLPLKMDMVLYMNGQSSLYRRLIDEESKPLLHLSKGGTMATFDILEESYSQIFLNEKSYRIERLIDNMYMITENIPIIEWEKIYRGFLASPMTFIRASLGVGEDVVINNVDTEKIAPYNPLE